MKHYFSVSVCDCFYWINSLAIDELKILTSQWRCILYINYWSLIVLIPVIFIVYNFCFGAFFGTFTSVSVTHSVCFHVTKTNLRCFALYHLIFFIVHFFYILICDLAFLPDLAILPDNAVLFSQLKVQVAGQRDLIIVSMTKRNISNLQTLNETDVAVQWKARLLILMDKKEKKIFQKV